MQTRAAWNQSHLMGTPGGYEYCLSRFLIYSIALDPVHVEQFLPQRTVEIDLLRVNGIMLIRPFELPPEKDAQFIRITCTEKIPSSTAGFPIRGWACISHDVDRIRHIHMQPSRPFAACRLKGCHRIVHFRAYSIG